MVNLPIEKLQPGNALRPGIFTYTEPINTTVAIQDETGHGLELLNYLIQPTCNVTVN